MRTRQFLVVEFFVNNRGRLEFTDVFEIKGIRTARGFLKDEDEVNTVFAVYEVVDGGLVKFE